MGVGGGGCLNESYLSENRAPISSVQASDTLLGEDTFLLMCLLQPWTYTSFNAHKKKYHQLPD